MLKAIVVMDDLFTDEVYPKNMIKELEKDLEFVSEPITKKELADDLSILEEVDFIFSGWGGPRFDDEVLAAAPRLKMVFYGAGTIKNIVTDAFWEKGIRITTANAANAIAVAEFTLATTILGLKNTLRMNQKIKETREYPAPGKRNIRGGFQAKIGLISLGAIAKEVLKLYRNFDYEVSVYDPFLSDEEAKNLGVRNISLEKLFEESDVVSLHTPLLDATRGMIKKEHFLSMKENSTFINTARGAVVAEDEMIEALKERKDISAYLDVVYPEPPAKDSPLYEMENIFLTPHIAGSEGNEVARMGDLMVREFKAYINDEELKYEVSKEDFERMA